MRIVIHTSEEGRLCGNGTADRQDHIEVYLISVSPLPPVVHTAVISALALPVSVKGPTIQSTRKSQWLQKTVFQVGL